MFSKSTIVTLATLLSSVAAVPATATSASAAATVTSGSQAPAITAAPTSIDVAKLVDALLPSASLSSIDPAKVSQLESDALAYFSQYTASNPISKLLQDAVIDQLLAASDPTPEQTSQLVGLIQGAETGILANPTAYVASVEAAISPFAVAGEVSTYAGNLVQGLRTVVASDLSIAVPTADDKQVATGNAAAPHAAMPTAFVGAAAAAAAFGAALL